MRGIFKLVLIGAVLINIRLQTVVDYASSLAKYLKKLVWANPAAVLFIIAVFVLGIVAVKFSKPTPKCARCGAEYERDGLYGLDCPNKCPGR